MSGPVVRCGPLRFLGLRKKARERAWQPKTNSSAVFMLSGGYGAGFASEGSKVVERRPHTWRRSQADSCFRRLVNASGNGGSQRDALEICRPPWSDREQRNPIPSRRVI